MIDHVKIIKAKLKDVYDIVYKPIQCKGITCTIIYSTHITDEDNVNKNVIVPLMCYENTLTINRLVTDKSLVPCKIEQCTNTEEAIIKMLTDHVIISIQGSDKLALCPTKGTISREIRIPPTESVNRGPREGFNEDINTNISLVRKRIINPKLKLEHYEIGEKTKTSVVLAYIQDTSPKKLIDYVRKNINNNQLSYALDSHFISKGLEKKHTIFDTIGSSEKPDKIASQLLQGKASIFVDGTPFVLSMPFFFIENFQTSDDYYQNKYVATLSRIIKYLSFAIGLLLPPVYLALITFHFSFIPPRFLFRLASSRAGVPIPTFIELFLMLFFFYLAKEASVRLPKTTGTSLSIVAGLVLGQTSVEAGIASQITVVIAGIYAIASFVNSSISTPMYLWTSIMIILAVIVGFPGVIMGAMICIVHIASLDSCGYPFLFPLGTKRSFGMKDLIWVHDFEDMNNVLLKEGEIK